MALHTHISNTKTPTLAEFDLLLSSHNDERSFKTVSTLTLDVPAPSSPENRSKNETSNRKTRNSSRSPSSSRRRRGRSQEHHGGLVSPRKESRQRVSDLGDAPATRGKEINQQKTDQERSQRSRTRSPTRRTRNGGTRKESISNSSTEKRHHKHPSRSETPRDNGRLHLSSPNKGGRRCSITLRGRSESPAKQNRRRGGGSRTITNRRQSTSPPRYQSGEGGKDRNMDGSSSGRCRQPEGLTSSLHSTSTASSSNIEVQLDRLISLASRQRQQKRTEENRKPSKGPSGEGAPSPKSCATPSTWASSPGSYSASKHCSKHRRQSTTSDNEVSPPPPPFMSSPRTPQGTKRGSSTPKSKTKNSSGAAQRNASSSNNKGVETPQILNSPKGSSRRERSQSLGTVKDKITSMLRLSSTTKTKSSHSRASNASISEECVVAAAEMRSSDGSSSHSSNITRRSSRSQRSGTVGHHQDVHSNHNSSTKSNEIILTEEIERRLIKLVHQVMDERESQIMNRIDEAIHRVNQRVERCEDTIGVSKVMDSRESQNKAIQVDRMHHRANQRQNRSEGESGVQVIEIE